MSWQSVFKSSIYVILLCISEVRVTRPHVVNVHSVNVSYDEEMGDMGAPSDQLNCDDTF